MLDVHTYDVRGMQGERETYKQMSSESYPGDSGLALKLLFSFGFDVDGCMECELGGCLIDAGLEQLAFGDEYSTTSSVGVSEEISRIISGIQKSTHACDCLSIVRHYLICLVKTHPW